mgnify:CR=1 FL=1
MTECFIQSHSESGEACSCADCGWQGPANDLDMIADIQERVDAGCEVPAGQCPECGALAYLDSKALETEQTTAALTAARAMLAALERGLPLLEKTAHPFNHEHRACEVSRAAIAQARAAGIEPKE